MPLKMDVAIVGAGPTGCVIAILLAQRGHSISLYETYGETRNCKSRSINITLSERGIAALKLAIPNIHEVLFNHGARALGRIVHDKEGNQSKPTLYGENKEALISLKRNQLTDFLILELNKYEKIKKNFFHELLSVEHGAKLIFRNTKSEQLVHVEADFVIGADGAHSVVRHGMQKSSSLRFIEQTRHDHSYIEFYIPKNDSMDHNMLHMWPRHDFMMLALPNKDGSFCGNFFMIHKPMQQVMQSADTLREFCREHFKDLLGIIGEEELVKDIKPCPNFSPYCLTSIKCEPYHAWGKAVLIGDAAHAVVPFYGQGMNAGFQDCQELVRILDEACPSIDVSDYLPSALQRFSDVQCRNGQAIADLALEHYTQLRSGIASKGYCANLFLKRTINTALSHRWPLEYAMVAFSQMSFADCLLEKRRQDNVLNRGRYFLFCASLLLLAVAVLCALKK